MSSTHPTSRALALFVAVFSVLLAVAVCGWCVWLGSLYLSTQSGPVWTSMQAVPLQRLQGRFTAAVIALSCVCYSLARRGVAPLRVVRPATLVSLLVSGSLLLFMLVHTP